MAKTAAKRSRKTTRRKARSGAGRSGMAPWYLLGVAMIAGIVYLDGREAKPPRTDTAVRTASIERGAKPAERRTAVSAVPAARPQAPVAEKLPAFSGKWFICTTQTDYCVLDGNTILYAGRKVRLADIDAPAVADARCDAERLRGGDAKLRLRELLNGGQVTVAPGSGDASGSGLSRRVVMRDGQSVGSHLVREGLARPWTGRHQSWCS
ncbi:thermonuclease family protein [Shinella daejeonensis]|uniref:thermonuclease family protein n=1 Tax=Shinella daejeonensis TaxID=659017 RepID=UPI0020C7C666|nr:thermonuclease family protein [Shinella daejeonensis]MCP8894149.1 thermonuclease family protein [Shinella daejeonensis]